MNDIQSHRVAIGLFHANQRPPRKNIRNFYLICNAFREIVYIMCLLAFFMALILKEMFSSMFLSINICSPLITVLLIKFVSNGKQMTQKDLSCLIYPIIIDSLLKKQKTNPKKLIINIFCLFFSIKVSKFIFLCGDIHINPGDTFDFCVWNCNFLIAHNFSRVSLIETYNSIHRLKLIGLTETGLNPDTENSNLEIPGFSIIRSDLPTSHSHRGVLLYYKNDLAVKHRPDLQLHSNTIAVQIEISRKKVIFILAYRKFGQTSQDFNIFHDKIDLMLKNAKSENPHCVILAGDLNAHLREWYGDKDDHYGLTFQRIFNKHGISQLIHEPTFITNKSKTCIDILCTDQPNLVLKNEVHPSLHTNCHHQVIYTKMNISCPPPLPHKRHVWHYSRAKTESMQKASYDYVWEQTLANLNPDKQVDLFDEVIINISKNFIPNEFKTFNPKEPPWITKSCKSFYSKYKRKYKNFARKNFPPEEKKN